MTRDAADRNVEWEQDGAGVEEFGWGEVPFWEMGGEVWMGIGGGDACGGEAEDQVCNWDGEDVVCGCGFFHLSSSSFVSILRLGLNVSVYMQPMTVVAYSVRKVNE